MIVENSISDVFCYLICEKTPLEKKIVTQYKALVPADTPHDGTESTVDSRDVQYRYVQTETSGTWTFRNPGDSSRPLWSLRLLDNDGNGSQVGTSIDFTAY